MINTFFKSNRRVITACLSAGLVMSVHVSSVAYADKAANIIDSPFSYFVQPRIGYSSASLKSEYKTSPVYTQNTKAEETERFSLLIGVSPKNKPEIRVYGKGQQNHWQNGLYSNFGLGADYALKTVPFAEPYAGAFIGYGSFRNDLLDQAASGLTYGVNVGAKKQVLDGIAIEAGLAYEMMDLKTDKTTTQYTRSLALENMTTFYIGVNFLSD